MSAVDKFKFVSVLERLKVCSVLLLGMPRRRMRSAAVSSLSLSVDLGCTVKYGDFCIRDAKDVIGSDLSLDAAIAIRAAVGETAMSGTPPRECRIGAPPRDRWGFDLGPPRGIGCAPP